MPLQTEADGEEVLDDGIVQVSGDSLPILDHRHPAKPLLKPCCGDCGPRDHCHRLHHRLVVIGEPAALLGQVEVAEHVAADPHWDSEKGVHRGVAGRETDRVGVLGDLVDADGLADPCDGAEYATTFGEVSDPSHSRCVHPHVDEVDERAVPTEDPEGGIPRAGQVAAGGDRSAQRRCQIGSRGDACRRSDQPADLIGG